MIRIIRQIARGCGYLPHVGSHPGISALLFFILMGVLVGVSRGGLRGAIGGGLFMSGCLLPFFFVGAYERAECSDREVKKNDSISSKQKTV